MGRRISLEEGAALGLSAPGHSAPKRISLEEGAALGLNSGGANQPQEPQEEPTSPVVSAIRGGLDTLTWGTAPKASAAIEAVGASAFGPKTFGQEYDERKAQNLAAYAKAEKDNPGSYLAGSIGAAFIPMPGGQLGVLKKAGDFVSKGGLLGRIARGTAMTGLYGGVHAAGHSTADTNEGLWEDVKQGAQQGMAVGLPLTVAGAAVGKLGRSMAGKRTALNAELEAKANEAIRSAMGGKGAQGKEAIGGAVNLDKAEELLNKYKNAAPAAPRYGPGGSPPAEVPLGPKSMYAPPQGSPNAPGGMNAQSPSWQAWRAGVAPGVKVGGAAELPPTAVGRAGRQNKAAVIPNAAQQAIEDIGGPEAMRDLMERRVANAKKAILEERNNPIQVPTFGDEFAKAKAAQRAMAKAKMVTGAKEAVLGAGALATPIPLAKYMLGGQLVYGAKHLYQGATQHPEILAQLSKLDRYGPLIAYAANRGVLGPILDNLYKRPDFRRQVKPVEGMLPRRAPATRTEEE